MQESFRSRWTFGMLASAIVAGIASLWVIVAYVLTHGQSLASQGLSLPVVLAVYFFGAFAGSVVFALVEPLFGSRLGAGLAGFLITLPLFTAIAATLPDADLGSLETWRAIAMSAAFLGGLVGLITWRPGRPRERQ